MNECIPPEPWIGGVQDMPNAMWLASLWIVYCRFYVSLHTQYTSLKRRERVFSLGLRNYKN